MPDEPASCVAVTIRRAVAEALAGADLSQEFEPIEAYLPTFQLEEMGETLRVTVLAVDVDETAATRRGTKREDHLIQVGIQRKCDADDVETLDGLLGLTQEVRDFLAAAAQRDMGGATWIGNEQKPLYHPDHLRDRGVFTAVISATYRILRRPQTGGS